MIGAISFFYLSGQTNPFIVSMFSTLYFMAVYGFFSSIWFIVREIRRKNDELVKKVVVDSMSMAFVIIVILHVVQMVVRITYFNKTGNDINLIVTSGYSIGPLGDSGSHLEAFGFDLAIFSVSLFVNRLRYAGRTEWIKHSHATESEKNSEEVCEGKSEKQSEETIGNTVKF